MACTYQSTSTALQSRFKQFMAATGYCMVLIAMTNCSIAGTLEKPVSERQAFIQTEANDTIHPWVIAKAEDGGYLVAGEIGVSAGIIKTDGQGKMLWQYSTYAHQTPSYPYKEAMYRGIVSMPDGSIWACGSMPILPGYEQKGLLTHLDGNGRLIEERLLAPLGTRLVYLLGCAKWESNVVVVGSVTRFPKEKLRPGKLTYPRNSYWVIVLDPEGKVKWGKEIPTPDFDPIGGINGTVLLTVGHNLVFCMDNGAPNTVTEFLSINRSGEVQARRKLEGVFRLVRPVRNDGRLQALGWGFKDHSLVVTTFDRNLREIQTVRDKRPPSFLPRVVYRLPDQSYVFFGSSVHRFGEEFKSAVVHMNGALKNEQEMDLDGDFSDDGSIWAATPAHQPDEFVAARIFFKADHRGDISGRHGAVLNFIKIK